MTNPPRRLTSVPLHNSQYVGGSPCVSEASQFLLGVVGFCSTLKIITDVLRMNNSRIEYDFLEIRYTLLYSRGFSTLKPPTVTISLS